VRSGYNPHERKAARWSVESLFSPEDVLESFATRHSPEVKYGRRFVDAWDVLVMDNESRAGKDFLDNMTKTLCRVPGAEKLLAGSFDTLKTLCSTDSQ
jgi:hypothetical protein